MSAERSRFLTDLSMMMDAAPDAELGDIDSAAFLARKLTDMYQSGDRSKFEEIFGLVEHYVIYGEPDQQQLVIVGFLENLKNISAWLDLDYVVFEEWLGPESHVAWRWLEKRWQGKRSLASMARDGIAKPE